MGLFFVPHLTQQHKFYAAFFTNCSYIMVVLTYFTAVVKDVEPSSPPVITLSLENGGRKLHRPVPVHMSRLVEKETEEEEEAKTEEAEVNQNYKQYVKANPIPQKEDEEPSERHKKDSSASSHSSSTSRG